MAAALVAAYSPWGQEHKVLRLSIKAVCLKAIEFDTAPKFKRQTCVNLQSGQNAHQRDLQER